MFEDYTVLIFFDISEHHGGACDDPHKAPCQNPDHQAAQEISTGIDGIGQDCTQGAETPAGDGQADAHRHQPRQ